MVIPIFLYLYLFVIIIAQAFRGYRLRYFFRIFPGFLSGVLISFTTGYLMFMDSLTGKVAGVAASFGGDKLLADMISNGNILELLQDLVTNERLRNILMKILPDSAKVFMVFAVLICIACTIVCAALEKPGVALELFAYGYTLVASMFTANGSVLLGAILGIAAGVLLGMLGYRISRGWIIVAPNLVNFLIVLSFAFPFLAMVAGNPGAGNRPGTGSGNVFGVILMLLAVLALAVAIPIGVRRQFKETAVSKDGTAPPAAASAGPKVNWAEKCKALADSVSAKLSAPPKSNPTPGSAPPAGGQKFCGKCGNPLASGAKFCAKCGTPTRSVEDSVKPM